MGKLSNMMYMIDLLNTGNIYTLKELSEKIGITERMIRYYKNEICSNGIAIESFKGPNGGYFMIDKIKNYTSINKYDIQLLDNIYNLLLNSNFKYLDKFKEFLDKSKKMYSIYDETSGSYNSCFPIFDDYGNVLKGVEATLQLVKSAKILPTVSLEKADKDIYKYNLAKVESNIVAGRQELLKKYNNLISSNFNNCNGIDDLFDKESGSVIIPMYEMELLQNSLLKDFWLSTENEKLMYSLRDNNNYLLRGSKTYYYFISNRISVNRKGYYF